MSPVPLRVAALLVLAEAGAFVVLTIVQVTAFSADRFNLAWTTTAFFLLYAAFLAWCARGVLVGQSWARSPLVLAQLLQLGVAWSFTQGEAGQGDKTVAWVLAAAAIAILIGIFHPRSISYLGGEEA